MKSLVSLTLCALALAGVAHATTTDPRLDAVASRLSSQSVSVLCYTQSEWDQPDAWGYVYLWTPEEHMAPEVCEGALAIADGNTAVPAWKQALGALVLAHESYHLALRYRTRDDESRTECRAIRHFRYVVQFLGGSSALADSLLPYALAIHWRIAAVAPAYFQQSCVVPNWWP